MPTETLIEKGSRVRIERGSNPAPATGTVKEIYLFPGRSAEYVVTLDGGGGICMCRRSELEALTEELQ